MKLNSVFILMLSVLLVSLSCSSDNEATSNENVVANEIATITIDGMTCEVGCAGYIAKKLNKTEGVKSCDIDFETKVATVKFDNAQISAEDIKEIIENLNDGQYEVTDMSSETMSSSSSIRTQNSNDEISVRTSIEIPNIFSVLKSIL
jgi:periplasmic mercuric ion binding protein